ncbi:MAG: purine-binding chemotaxis protein CheW [candidate division NC10 bacterium]|nr:purine-binding chemotaxis protein CheW [candidate division NC10 bacterium]
MNGVETLANPRSKAVDSVQLVAFTIGGRLFATEIAEIKEIISYRRPTPTPKRPPFVEGMIEHKGQILPVISLRRRLGVTKGSAGAILLFRWGEKTVGLSVDAAHKVVSVEPISILSPPPRLFGIKSDYIKGVTNLGGRPLIWLDHLKLLTSEEEIVLVV